MKRTVTHEKYYTAPALAERCVRFTRDLIGFEQFSLFVEPSAGEGSFLRLLPSDRRVGIDIEPTTEAIHKADFLQWRPPPGQSRILTVGNPPFGQRGALAVKFVQHASQFSDAVAFILPRSFNKYTFQDRLDPYLHLVGAFDCDDEFRDVARDSHVSVRTVFQVWERRQSPRERKSRPDVHPHFSMRHAHLSRTSAAELNSLRRTYAFTIPQVGSNFRPRDVDSVERGSHWFIKPLVPDVRERFEQLSFDFLDGMNTAHKSLSKRDIVFAYSSLFADDDQRSVIESDQLTIW